MKKIIIGIIIILFINFGLGIYINHEINKKREYNLEFTIAKDKTLGKQLKKLPYSQNFIFKLYLKYRNKGKNIKAGTYEFNGLYNYIELINILEKGNDKLIKLTIPEGYTVSQIANILEEKGLSKDKFYKELNLAQKDFPYLTPNGNFEGYLYPDTYLLPEKLTEKKVVEEMLKEFLKKFPSKDYPDKEEFYKKLIMASILEREAQNPDEKKIMAGVFYNRMKKNMTLSSDATVNFIYNYTKKRMYYKDLKIDSPYNTYIYKGLPPAPICNPDKKSVLAAINPDKNEYLFFVAIGDGNHHFTKTYNEHLEFQKKNRRNK